AGRGCMDEDEPDPLTELAGTAMAGQPPESERAWGKLCAPESEVFRIARRASRRACACNGWHYPMSHPQVTEFLDEVPDRLFRYRENFVRYRQTAGGVGPTSNLFARWCEPVLFSGFCQTVRVAHALNMMKARELSSWRPAEPSRRAQNLRRRMAADGPLSERDLSRIARWSPNDRVFLP